MVIVYAVKIPEKSTIHDFLKEYILSRGLKGGIILGIGGLEYAEVGHFDPASRRYLIREIKAGETVLEVSSTTGNYLVKQDGDVSVHVHVTLATPGNVLAGHLVKGIVNPFIEAFLVELGSDVEKAFTHR
ncbi:MAG: DUF296 domain-containing protein [Thermofilaceae archaeon]